MASKQVQLLDDCQDGETNKGVRRSSSGPPPPPPDEGLRCPRCDSPNTKFCYYNNYSFTQPRYYCKVCQRYWTRGGALRNVPVGGGCRKNKKLKSSSSYSSSTSSSASRLGLDNIKDPFLYSSETINRFKFFHGFSSEFNLPYASSSQLWSYGDQSNSLSSVGIGASTASGSSLLDINYLIGNFSETTMNNTNTNSRLLTSTIESLSSINQDMHWKVQQQRLAMFYGGDQDHHHNNKETIAVSDLPGTYLQNQNQHLPISFHVPIASESLGFASDTTPTPNASFLRVDNDINTSSDWYQKLQYL